MSHSATERYGVLLAPDGLALVQDLLNTRSAGRPRQLDLLGDVESARQWLEQAAALWRRGTGEPAPRLTLSEQELPRLRALRDHVRVAIQLRLRSADDEQADDEQADDDEAAPPEYELGTEHPLAFSGGLRLTLDRDGTLAVTPEGDGASWVVAAVLGEIQLAQQVDLWRRLKVCRNDRCLGAFFDRSRNNSGVWHDVHICGNAANLRASRARRRASLPGTDGGVTAGV